jgi:N-formylmaleamate deformylase
MTAGPELLAELRTLGARSRWVTRGGVRLHCLDYGGPQRPLLVLPGITSPARTWHFVAEALRDVARPVVMDLRGRGLSSPGRGHALEDYAADVEVVTEALRLDGSVLLGHSLGGRIAAAVAARGTARLSGAIVVDPPLSGPGRGSYPTPRSAFIDQLREARAGTTARAVARHYPGWPEEQLAVRARWLATCDEAAVVAAHAGFEREDFMPWWSRVPPPAVFVYGADSTVVTAAGAVEAARVNPRALRRRVAGAGHMVPWDAPAEFTALIRDLLATRFTR